MIAEIFHFSNQESIVNLLKDLLKEYVYKNIIIDLHEFEPYSYEFDGSKFGWRYVKLLQASIPPQSGIGLSAKQFETFGYRFYIQVYFPLSSSYYGYGYENLYPDTLFPAVAVRERMIVVPQIMKQKLEAIYKDTLLLNPLELGDVHGVDFEDEKMLTEVISVSGRRLRNDFLQELKAYASYQDLQEYNLSTIAKDMDVSAGFAKDVLQVEAIKASFYQQLSCKLEQSKLPINRWTRLELTIENHSEVELPELLVQILGPVKLLPLRIQVAVPPRAASQCSLALMPEEPGDFPLEIRFLLPEDQWFMNWLPVHHIWLHVDE